MAEDVGLVAERINKSDVVGVPQIAEALDVDERTVHAWIRRKADFPAPFLDLGKQRIWDLTEVVAWFLHHRHVHVSRNKRGMWILTSSDLPEKSWVFENRELAVAGGLRIARGERPRRGQLGDLVL